jgi:hypothetical protein
MVKIMLRPEMRRWYGAKHRRLRSELIERLGPICQNCKREHPKINLAHLTHDVTDVDSVTLLCPRCHAKHDARQRHAMTRRTLARRRGQLWFNAALEYAPFASWEIPESIRDAAIQQPLFPAVT